MYNVDAIKKLITETKKVKEKNDDLKKQEIRRSGDYIWLKYHILAKIEYAIYNNQINVSFFTDSLIRDIKYKFPTTVECSGFHFGVKHIPCIPIEEKDRCSIEVVDVFLDDLIESGLFVEKKVMNSYTGSSTLVKIDLNTFKSIKKEKK